ncbi:MAG: hypothetical protein KGM47_00525 [Acidobacteriota bacterium]|nr:hypothetical protein [Acidobacteriota bacterium]
MKSVNPGISARVRTRRRTTPFALALSAGLCLLLAIPLQARQKTAKDYTIQTPPAPNFSSLEWLLGVWSGKTTSKGSQGRVLLSLAYELGKRFMIFREELSLPATKAVSATHEGVMGIIHASATGTFEMDLYSSTGFVTHYRVTATHGLVTFSPDGGAVSPPGWLFRRAIRHTNPGECNESVEVAPPGGNFFNYYSADLFQVSSPTTAPAKPPLKGGQTAGGAPGN